MGGLFIPTLFGYLILAVLSATCATLNTHIEIELAIIAALALLQLLSGPGVFMQRLLACYEIMVVIQYVLFPILPETVEMLLPLPVVNIRGFRFLSQAFRVPMNCQPQPLHGVLIIP